MLFCFVVARPERIRTKVGMQMHYVKVTKTTGVQRMENCVFRSNQGVEYFEPTLEKSPEGKTWCFTSSSVSFIYSNDDGQKKWVIRHVRAK